MVKGKANIIVSKGATLNLKKGIQVANNASTNAELHIWGGTADSGTIVATSDDSNAAIGGNYLESCGTVVVHSGSVEATSDGKGAAIGGGSGFSLEDGRFIGGDGGHVTILGGKVTANGGEQGAGIGGGMEAPGGVVSISGGTVSAVGSGGAAIGGGGRSELTAGMPGNNSGGSVVIEGDATVNAKSENGMAIGAGRDNDDTGQLLIHVALCVKKDDVFVTRGDREDSCCNSGAIVVSPCAHEDVTYIQAENGHKARCVYCCGLDDAEEEAHTFNDEGECSVCGFERVVTAPEFKTVNLTLGSKIGMTFWLKLPEMEGVDYNDSSMEFTINNKTNRSKTVLFKDAKYNAAKGRYGFTFDLSSIEMADSVTASFSYGQNNMIRKSYSVKSYVQAVDDKQAKEPGYYDSSTLNLVHAIANYGHYMQPYLANANKWVLGTDYMTMYQYYADLNDMWAASYGSSAHKFSSLIAGTGVKNATCSMRLDATTELDVYITPKDADADLTASAVFMGKTYKAERQRDGRWLVRIDGMKPHQLGETIEISGECGGAFSISLSALAYVHVVFSNDSFGDDAKEAFTSLYHYWAYTTAYRQSL